MQETLDLLKGKDVTFSFPTGGVFLPVRQQGTLSRLWRGEVTPALVQELSDRSRQGGQNSAKACTVVRTLKSIFKEKSDGRVTVHVQLLFVKNPQLNEDYE